MMNLVFIAYLFFNYISLMIIEPKFNTITEYKDYVSENGITIGNVLFTIFFLPRILLLVIIFIIIDLSEKIINPMLKIFKFKIYNPKHK